MSTDNYKTFKELFFVKENLRGYVRNYTQTIDIFITKKKTVDIYT